VLLLHGFPYDIHSYVEVIPLLADAGMRVIVPYLRGHGPTRFLDPATPRSGQQAAIGADVIDLMDALAIPGAILAGYDWGGRAACVAAALWPQRCIGVVSVNGYLIQDISAATSPIRARSRILVLLLLRDRTRPPRSHRQSTRCRQSHLDAQLAPLALRRCHARSRRPVLDNDDYVDVVIHSYRHRLGLAPGYAPYDEVERRLAGQTPITVPAITLEGQADGNFPRNRQHRIGKALYRPTHPPSGPQRWPQPAAGKPEVRRGGPGSGQPYRRGLRHGPL
jgi:pimeloyl-ACP methyl ester carboxylesterase